jgi:hypothetical protein
MSAMSAKRLLNKYRRCFDGAITLPAIVISPSNVGTAPEVGEVVSISETKVCFRSSVPGKAFFTLWVRIDGRWEIDSTVFEDPWQGVHYIEILPRVGWTLKIGSAVT